MQTSATKETARREMKGKLKKVTTLQIFKKQKNLSGETKEKRESDRRR
jgi:hypothetical protein